MRRKYDRVVTYYAFVFFVYVDVKPFAAFLELWNGSLDAPGDNAHNVERICWRVYKHRMTIDKTDGHVPAKFEIAMVIFCNEWLIFAPDRQELPIEFVFVDFFHVASLITITTYAAQR